MVKTTECELDRKMFLKHVVTYSCMHRSYVAEAAPYITMMMDLNFISIAMCWYL